MTIYPARKAQIAFLVAEKVTVLAKYLDFANLCPEKSANVLLEQTGVNKHVIELERNKEPPYRPIYNLRPAELKSLKIYIETNLANAFIRTSKSPASDPILFVCKPNHRFCWYINYQSFNNLTIKNWYLLPFIGESLDWLV